jgi:hypothetical protein
MRVMLDSIIAAATGFLLAVLWFYLMFDVQVIHRRRRAGGRARPVRATTGASPRPPRRWAGGAVVMLVLLVSQRCSRDDAPVWASIVSFVAADGIIRWRPSWGGSSPRRSGDR